MNAKLILPGVLAAAIAAAIPFTAGAAPTNLTVRDVAVTPAQSQADPVVRIIVNYREGSRARNDSAVAVQSINTTFARSGLVQMLGGNGVSHMRKLGTGHDLFRLPVAVDRVTAESLLRQIEANPDVVSAEIDVRVHATPAMKPALVPNDPLLARQWHLAAPDGTPDGQDNVPNRSGANGFDAVDMADGTGAIVAVLDTGITRHPDLDTSLGDAGYDMITDSAVSGRPTDDRAPGGWDLGDWDFFSNSSWHGTHVSGTIAQITNNNVGMAGIAPGAKVLPVRVLGTGGGYLSDVADGIVWASGGTVPGMPTNENKAHVINMSLGGGGTCTATSVMGTAIAGAIDRGTAVVVSAGNSDANTIDYQPANCPGAIAVAATGITSRRAFYSNWGDRVDIAAPGGGVYVNDGSGGAQVSSGFVWQAINPGSTTPVPVEQINPDTAYTGMAGTSMAAPHVAGVVALIQSARLAAGQPPLSPSEVLELMQATVTPFTVPPEGNKPIGPGIVNAAAAVALVACDEDDEDCGPPPPPPPPPATPIINKVPIRGLSGGVGTWVLEVPANASGPLNVITNGGSGDLTLLVHRGDAPEDSADWELRSARRGNNETVRVQDLQPGQYFIRLIGEPSAYQNVTLRAIHN